MRLEQLGANQPPDRFYAGGAQIAAFRAQGAGRPPVADDAATATASVTAPTGAAEVAAAVTTPQGAATGTAADPPPPALHVPEDWVGSLTTLFGEQELGLTRLADGRTLREHVTAAPDAWLGPAHVASYGDDAGLLVKLLDAGQRLPVHAHPDRAFAAEQLGLAHGKTEAWVALAAADVHLAFARDVDADELAGWVARQDTAAMLGAMHTLRLERGDAVLVPAGLPHAIGAGAFVVELQEPTDLSILAEWAGFAIDGAAAGHLGLGFDVALRAVDRRGWRWAEVERLRGARAGDLGDLLPAAAPFFRVERWRGPSSWEAGYAVVVVTAGAGAIVGDGVGPTAVEAGQTWLVAHDVGPLRLVGDVEVLRCRPPAP